MVSPQWQQQQQEVFWLKGWKAGICIVESVTTLLETASFLMLWEYGYWVGRKPPGANGLCSWDLLPQQPRLACTLDCQVLLIVSPFC